MWLKLFASFQIVDDALRAGWQLNFCGLLKLLEHNPGRKSGYGSFRGSVLGQSLSGLYQEAKVGGGGGHVQEVGGRHMTNPLPHPVPSIFNFILIS